MGGELVIFIFLQHTEWLMSTCGCFGVKQRTRKTWKRIHRILYNNLYRGKIYQVTHRQVVLFHNSLENSQTANVSSSGLNRLGNDDTTRLLHIEEIRAGNKTNPRPILLTKCQWSSSTSSSYSPKQKNPNHSHSSDMQHLNTDISKMSFSL